MIERTTDIQKLNKLLSTSSIVILTGPRGDELNKLPVAHNEWGY
jgi:hypothetical protein